MEHSLFEQNEDSGTEGLTEEPESRKDENMNLPEIDKTNGSLKKKSKKKSKDIFCGLSELQLAEAFRSLCFTHHLKKKDPGRKVSDLQTLLSIASHPGKDLFFSDYDPSGYFYLTPSERKTSSSIKLIKNFFRSDAKPGKYLVAAGAALALSKAGADRIVILEAEFHGKDAAELYAVLRINKELKIPLMLVLHTAEHYDLIKRTGGIFSNRYIHKADRQGCMLDLEASSGVYNTASDEMGLSILVAGKAEGSDLIKGFEKHLISSKILSADGLRDIKVQAKTEVDDHEDKYIAVIDNVFTDGLSLTLSNDVKEGSDILIDINDRELMLIALGSSLAGLKTLVACAQDVDVNEIMDTYKRITGDRDAAGLPFEILGEGNSSVGYDSNIANIEQYNVQNDIIIIEEDNSSDARVNINSISELPGESMILKEGEDMTIIVFSKSGEQYFTSEVLDELFEAGIDPDVIISNRNYELDMEIISSSIEKTGKILIFIDGDEAKTFASEIGCYIVENYFHLLDAPLKREQLTGDYKALIISSCLALDEY